MFVFGCEKIPLYGRRGIRGYAIIDESMVSLASQHRWWMHKVKRSKVRYAYSQDWSRGLRFGMHQLLTNRIAVTDGLVVDHINGNGLDNRMANLRVVTNDENLKNRHHSKARPKSPKVKRLHARNISGVTGVRVRPTGIWIARACRGRKHIHLGCFKTKEAAVAARLKFDHEERGDVAQKVC